MDPAESTRCRSLYTYGSDEASLDVLVVVSRGGGGDRQREVGVRPAYVLSVSTRSGWAWTQGPPPRHPHVDHLCNKKALTE